VLLSPLSVETVNTIKIMTTTLLHPVEANGTSLKGYVTASFNKLVEVFGEPSLNDPPSNYEKVTREWVLGFPCGTVATIYNWKNYGTDPLDHEDYQWHIGGHTSSAVELVLDAIGNK
jgi:hypothetical protein